MPPVQRTVQRTEPRRKLSHQQVAETALDLLDREGIDAFSMRRLADELGVGTMTLYGYFRSKRELLDAVVDVAMPGLDPELGLGPWRERLAALVRTARRGLVRHPALVQIRVREPVLRPDALRFSEAGLRILMAAGFDPGDAARAFRLLFTYTLGYAAFSPSDAEEDNRAAARAAIAALPPEQYPALTSSREEAAAAMGGEEAFEYGLERILDGLDASLGSRSRPTPGSGR